MPVIVGTGLLGWIVRNWLVGQLRRYVGQTVSFRSGSVDLTIRINSL